MYFLFIQFRWLDVVDILLVAILIYQLYHIVKGTVAIRILAGVLSLFVFWKLVEALKMELLAQVLGQFLGVGVIALIIVFQQELRRFLLLIGTTGFRNIPVAKRLFKWQSFQRSSKVKINSILIACENMSRVKSGALIVITRENDLQHLMTSAEMLDAKYSSRVIESIFYKNSPLHDGAVIIDGERIKAARCVLPTSENPNFPARLGTRHRAGAGITEQSDAIAIIVSEQTGDLTVAMNGELKTCANPNELRDALYRELA